MRLNIINKRGQWALKLNSVGGDAVHPDLGNASQARHGILQSGASALPLSPLSRLSGASRTLERAIKASHRGLEGPLFQLV